MANKHFEEVAARVRIDVVRAIHKAGSGHPGGSLSAADIVTALYFKEMNIDPAEPKKADRDKFILSKGHAGPVQYAALAERGYYPVEDMMSLRKMGSTFQGHPNMHKVPGVEMSTGSLGQGISVATGMAWKSGIAAEIIGLARNSIGNELYKTKIYLMIPELFAWTIVIVLLSILFEAIIKTLIKLISKDR